MADVTIVPDPFHLVEYDAGRLRDLVAEVAEAVGLPDDVAIRLEVDEALPHPILGSEVDVVDGAVVVWCSGGNFEARDRSRQFSERHARAQLTAMLLRAADRLSAGFAGAPADAELTHPERAAWDASAWGRVAQTGVAVHEQKRRYEFRLQHGFTDEADAAFDRLWSAPVPAWADITGTCERTGASGRPKPKTPIGLLRRS